MPPEPILSASVPRYKRHCCSFNSFRKISYWCWVVIPSLYHISPPFGSYLRMSPKRGSLTLINNFFVDFHRTFGTGIFLGVEPKMVRSDKNDLKSQMVQANDDNGRLKWVA